MIIRAEGRLDFKRMLKESFKSSHSNVRGCVCVGGFINLQCLLRLIVKQDVAPPSLVLADVIKMKLHGWKHLLHLLQEVMKIMSVKMSNQQKQMLLHQKLSEVFLK